MFKMMEDNARVIAKVKGGGQLRVASVLAGVVVLGSLVAAWVAWYYWPTLSWFYNQAVELFQDRDRLHHWLAAQGRLAPLAFILVQCLQVLIAPIPGEVTGILGGFLFGLTGGFLYSSVGLTLGCALAFLLGRFFQKNFLGKFIRQELMEKFAFLGGRTSALIVFLLYLVPGVPKDYLSYILGLSQLPLRAFIAIVTLARMPCTFILTLQGAEIYKGNYLVAASLWALIIFIALISLYYREKFYTWLRRLGLN
jgi:uncharacterized membrane protein YdjX (TVP38/TMEM64 family)